MSNQHVFRFLPLGILMLGCGTDAPTSPPDEPDPPATGTVAASVSIDQGDVAFGAIGSTVQLQATVKDSLGAVITNSTLVWSVDGGGVVSISPQGVLTSVGTGRDAVRVTAGPVSDVIDVRVTQLPVAVQIQTPSTTMGVLLGKVAFQAQVVDSMSTGIPGMQIDWTTSDPSVVTIDQSGNATALAEGVADIEAEAGSLNASAQVTVRVAGPLGGTITGAVAPCTSGKAASIFNCSGLDLLSYVPIGGIGGADDVRVNDLWGWTDPIDDREYALVGRVDGVAFVDVSDPVNPVFIGQLLRTLGSPPRVWRDLKVYADHVFIVADGSGSHGMQVFDLRELRTYNGVPLNFSETARYTGIASAHNIVINEATGYAYAVGSSGGSQTCGGGLHMIDIRDPQNPVFAGCFSDALTGFASTGYTHDGECILYDGPDADYSGREICFGLNETALSIADVSDKGNPIAVSRASYPNVGYAHQGWVTDDRRYLFSNDELDELQGGASLSRTLIWDISDLDDPILAAEHLGPNRATDHNLYIRGSLLYQSNYQFGIRVLDIGDPVNPSEVGFFDTAPSIPNTPGFDGSWSNYPFFDSGILVVTSWDEGLFVLKLAG